MSSTITGIVKNGVVVPSGPLPENAEVHITLDDGPTEGAAHATAVLRLTPTELRKLPREQRQAILAAGAALAEEDYRTDRELTGFEAFSEEELDDDETDAGSR